MARIFRPCFRTSNPNLLVSWYASRFSPFISKNSVASIILQKNPNPLGKSNPLLRFFRSDQSISKRSPVKVRLFEREHQLNYEEFENFMIGTKDEIFKHLVLFFKDENGQVDTGHVTGMLYGRLDSDKYFDIKLLSDNALGVILRYAMENLYVMEILPVILKIDSVWLYFNEEGFKEFFSEDAKCLNRKTNYKVWGLLQDLEFGTGSFNENLNTLSRNSFPPNDHHQKALLFVVVAISESLRFPFMRSVVKQSLVKPDGLDDNDYFQQSDSIPVILSTQ